MEKDLESFYRHDNSYNSIDFQKVLKDISIKKDNKHFENYGFEKAVGLSSRVKIHIDIGSGAGWLINKTASLFEKIYAIEPSEKALEYSKQLNKNFANITFVNKDMVEAYKSLDLKQPYLVTTSAVFSHIKDYYVKQALTLIDQAPEDSRLFFCEPYDKNIQRPFWYVRSKEWWQEQLKNWDLEFWDIVFTENGKKESYKKGIYGICRGEGQARKKFKNRKIAWKIYWHLGGLYHKIRALLVFVFKKLLSIKDQDA